MASRTKKPIGRLLVTQSNNLIEADYSKSNLSANPLKLFKLAIARLNPKDKDLRLIRIKLPVYRQYMGYKAETTYGRLNQDLHAYCLSLNSQVISIAMKDGSILNAFAISSWRLDLNNDELILEVSGQLKPFLLQLRGNYTSYHLWNIPRLKSSYAIRLYELLCSHRRFGKREFKLEELKNKVGCTYAEYGIFKRRVILKTQTELKTRTDLRFEFEEIKTGRKVTGIVFYTYPNDPEEDKLQQAFTFLDEDFTDEQDQSFAPDVLTIFKELGISKSSLDKMMDKGWEIIEDKTAQSKAQKRCRTLYDYYGEKLTLLQQSKQQKNPAGFFIKAVKEDWQNPALFKKKKVSEEKKSKAKIKQQVVRLEQEKDQKVKQLKNDTYEAVTAYFVDHSEALKTIIDIVLPVGNPSRKISVKADLSPLENYKRSAMIMALVNVHLREYQPQLLAHLAPQGQEIKEIEAKISDLKLKM